MIASPPELYEFGDFRLDLAERRLSRRDGTAVPLTPRVFQTLRYLVEHSGVLLEKQRLMESVWPDCVVEENNLVQNISTLRRVFGETPGAQGYIVTVPGRGYRFAAEVRVASPASEPASNRARESSAHSQRTESATFPGQRTQWRGRTVALLLYAFALLSAVGYFAWQQKSASRPEARTFPILEKSVAVLPFDNLSGDPENAYFADGIKDELLTRLSKIAALKVISRTSTQKYKSAPDNLREIAQQLGVANILEGSVQKSGDTARVTVQLINAASDTHLWAETYDRKLTDMFQVETEVAQRIAAALEATLTPPEARAVRARPTGNTEAHEAYLKGRYFWNKRTTESFTQAAAYMRRALELDPAYAQAYAGLADALLFLGGDTHEDEAVTKGRAALHKALELDDSLADAHASLGLVAMNFEWDWPKAEREFKRALALDPNNATAHQWYGEFLADLGRFDEGIAEVTRARELDPLSLIINSDLAKVHLIARRYDEASAQFQRVLEMDRSFDQARGLLGLTYSLLGAHEKAIGEFRVIKDIDANPLYLSWLGYAYGAAGQRDEAEAVARRLLEVAHEKYVSPVLLTWVYSGMGDADRAFACFERAFAERAPWAGITIKASPLYDKLRDDPRFLALLQRVDPAP